MRLVVVETPFAHSQDDEATKALVMRYLRAALHDCLMRGEAPFASHAIYTQPGVLDDWIPAQRAHGIAAGFAWKQRADATVVYEDLGITGGMLKGIEKAAEIGHMVAHRRVPGWKP